MRKLSSPSAAAPSSPGAPMSAYQAVKSFLKNGLAQGRWVPGTLMPSESELVKQFGLSRMTVNRALRELQAEGMVERLQGVGTFAAQLSRVASQLTIRDIHEEIEARGHHHHAKVIFVRQEVVTAKIAEQFGLALGANVYHSVNPICAPDYLKIDFTQTTPTAYLLAVAPFWQAQYTIESCLPTKQQANWLNVDMHLPCLVVVRRTLGRGLPITLGRLIHPGHLYQIEGSFAP
jgi:GntR family transcriptional regulator, histidine utilization repressor